jgi:hypothetical protein
MSQRMSQHGNADDCRPTREGSAEYAEYPQPTPTLTPVEYPYSTVCNGPNVSKRTVPYYDTVWFWLGYGVIIALAVLCCLHEAGW